MSDNVNRIIQKARIGEERAERLLEEMAVMQEQIDRLTRALAEARDKALEEAANTADNFAYMNAKMTDDMWIQFNKGDRSAGMKIAAAIRALKEKP